MLHWCEIHQSTSTRASFDTGGRLVGRKGAEPCEVSLPVRIGCSDFSMQTVPVIFEARSDLALLPSANLCVPDMVFARKDGIVVFWSLQMQHLGLGSERASAFHSI